VTDATDEKKALRLYPFVGKHRESKDLATRKARKATRKSS
jgi:hypothetical protein